MDIAQWFKNLVGQWRHGKKSHGPAHASRLREELREITEKGLGRISVEREIALPAAFATVRETIRALVERRVTLDDLEPDIDNLNDIIYWLRYRARDEVRTGKLTWQDFGMANDIAFGASLLNCGAFYDILRFNPEQSFGFADKVLGSETVPLR